MGTVVVTVLHLLGIVTVAVCQSTAPRFTKDMNGISIPEDTPKDTSVYQLEAQGFGGGPISYGMVQNEIFRVNRITGDVFITKLLDYETDPYIAVVVTAEDNNGLSKRDIQVRVVDANDEDPVFVRDTFKADIAENANIGTTIITDLRVTDVDFSNLLITVKCNTTIAANSPYPDACTTFQVNTFNASNKYWFGFITFSGQSGPLDYETKPFYQIPLTAFDGKRYTDRSIEITILNVQDAPPRFVKANDITKEEGLPAGTVLDYVRAVDGDTTNSRQIRYEFTQNSTGTLFSINPITGNITNNLPLDRESPEFARGYEDVGIVAREVISSNPLILGSDALTTARATLRINILDKNDRAPTFNPVNYEVTIPEDTPNRTPLPNLSLNVNDLDLGTNSMYELTLQQFNAEFEVSPSTAQGATPAIILVRNTQLIDYERGPRQYIMRVIARETNTTLRLSGTATVTVNIRDVNDNIPVFSAPSYRKNIPETAPADTSIVKIEATDIDSGIFGTSGIRYRLIGDGTDLFKIDESSGLVSVRECTSPRPGEGSCIDYERKRRYDMTVTASDENGQGQAVTVNLIITIDDVNDNAPTFTTQEYTSYIEEKKTVPNPAVIVTANDPDQVGGGVVYSILSDQTNLWQIGRTSGNVTAKQPIFYKDTPNNQGFFIITVRATDGTYNSTANVRINVIDINDNAPVFDQSNYNERIFETTRGNVEVLVVKATDQDSPTTGAGIIDYSIEIGASGKFVINGTTGVISTSPDATFDYDTQKRYTMTVKARDRGRPQQTGTSFVTIDIIDTNNKDPYFTPTTQRAEIYENVPVGYSVYKVLATDPDAQSNLNYFFIEPISAINPDGVPVDRNIYDFTQLFEIERQTGLIKTKSKLDRDRSSVVTLTMQVVDTTANPQQTGTGKMIIGIKEYNDQRPEFLPYTNVTVDEEQPIGTFVMALLANDVDDPIAEYQLVINPLNLFAIGYQTGVVSINSRIDYESIESTFFRATVWDSGTPRLNNSATVYVTVRNINDNSPIFTKGAYQASITEHPSNGVYVTQVAANDKDKGDYGVVRYSLDKDEKRFTINNVTGEIYVADGSTLDREVVGDIDLQVTASDSPLDAVVRRYSTVTVYINLNDINDNPPKFGQPEYLATIIETIPINTEVLQVFATDPDAGINAAIVFSKVPNSGDPQDFFTIAQKSGKIRINKSLLKNSGTYIFYVKAEDLNGNNGFNDTAKVTIIVLEATNSPPEWIIPPADNMTINVLEEQYLGMLVYDVAAKDSDRNDNGIIDYGFYVGGKYTTNTSEFRINSITGVIRAEKVYDRERRSKYILLLVARDRGDPYLETTRYLSIEILDVNDNIPTFPRNSNGETKQISFPDAEERDNITIGTLRGSQFEATDLDDPRYTKIYYYIISGNERGLFKLDPQTGRLSTTTISTYLQNPDSPRIYYLDIQATNNISDYTVIHNRRKRALDPSIATWKVQFKDANDITPDFTQSLYYGCLSTRSSLGQSVLQVVAIDRDSVGSVIYSIISGNTNNAFNIDSSSGIISNAVLMNAYGGTTFDMQVQATDQGQLFTRTQVRILVTEPSYEVKLVIRQSPSDVRQFFEQIKKSLESFTKPNSQTPVLEFVCASDIVNHVLDDGQTTTQWSDVYISAVCESCPNKVYTAESLLNELRSLKSTNPDQFDLLYIQDMELGSTDKDYLDKTPTMVVMILVIILIVLALVFLLLACCCIRKQKKDKQRLLDKRSSQRHLPAYDNSFHQVDDSFPIVYDNKGYVKEETRESMYAKVTKTTTPDDRAPQPIPESRYSEEINVVIRDESPVDSSVPASPVETPRLTEPAEEDYRIETEVL